MVRYNNLYTPETEGIPSCFVERDFIIQEARASMDALIEGYPQQSVIYYGLRGVGKTVLLKKIEEHAKELNILYEHIEITEKNGSIQRLINIAARFLKEISKNEAIEDSEFCIKASLSDQLTDRFVELGNAAKKSNDSICFFIDEIQCMDKEELGALISAIHRVNQKRLPIMVYGAGLPQVLKELGDTRSYSERLFRFVEIGDSSNSEL